MRARTPRRAAEERQYRKRRAEWLAGKSCVCCGKPHIPVTDELTIQHTRGRRGRWLLDEAWWVAMCWPCHRLATENPVWAFEQGFALSRVADGSVRPVADGAA